MFQFIVCYFNHCSYIYIAELDSVQLNCGIDESYLYEKTKEIHCEHHLNIPLLLILYRHLISYIINEEDVVQLFIYKNRVIFYQDS